jgi:hypothetical protein
VPALSAVDLAAILDSDGLRAINALAIRNPMKYLLLPWAAERSVPYKAAPPGAFA